MPRKGETSGNTWKVTTVRLTADQWRALGQAAVVRAAQKGGKPDASGILREALDTWLKKNVKAG